MIGDGKGRSLEECMEDSEWCAEVAIVDFLSISIIFIMWYVVFSASEEREQGPALRLDNHHSLGMEDAVPRHRLE